jgi:hypothetical protein
VFFVTMIGLTGSMIGWYWHSLIDCLSTPIHSLKFGPAVVWISFVAVDINLVLGDTHVDDWY